MLVNTQDNLVIEKLSMTPIDQLALDRLALKPQLPIDELRVALINVYPQSRPSARVEQSDKNSL